MRNTLQLTLFVALTLLVPAIPRGMAGEVPILYSTDLFYPHEDPDDYFDLATLFGLEEFDLRGVVLDGGQRQQQAPGKIPLEQMFRLTGRSAPYAIGLAQPLASAGEKAEQQPAEFQKGVQLILDVLRQSPKKVTLVTTGSVRDVAAAFNRDPQLLRDKLERFYAAISDAGVATEYEYNVQLDPQSYVRILQSGLPIYWCPCFEGGLWKRGAHATFWQFTQRDVLETAPPRLQNWFIYALTKPKDADPIAYLSAPQQAESRAAVWAMRRNMWSTAALLHAAGRQIYQRADGTFVPLSPQEAARQGIADRKVQAFRFDPVAVDVASNQNGKISLKVDLASSKPTMQVFRITDPRYEQIMTDCLKHLFSTLGK